MGCLSSQQISDINAEIATLSTRLAALNTAYTGAISGGIESYRLDSGENASAVKYRSLEDMQRAIDSTSSRIKTLKNQLAGRGIVNLNLRRK